MGRYQAGNLVAFVNKFQRCGRIVQIDNKGYKIDTGYDVIYAYENDIVLISSAAPIRPNVVMKKVDQVGNQVTRYNPDFREGLASFLASNSESAKLFADYVCNVSDKALKACIEAISNTKIDKITFIEIKASVNNNLLPGD